MTETPQYLLMKRGLYYAPNNCGYTGVKERAGRYLESDADHNSGITAIHEDDAPMFAPACWQDTKMEVLLDKINQLTKEVKYWKDKYIGATQV